ncbi:hypothetical protein CC53_gp081 [Rhizobium phage vB_RleS_L338C]|uniref:hypothetical protein n=1 Tax=Rhizobium phage vB_RleS_L338C TaxID=1414737 RepID=UPI0003D7EE63|nr:hypothetical protein CC53_gp081 [Rhizobium phage vB_RleS_L338C]AHC30498.1 hypothetical protein L338C_081 [Rhizobium phage vB_RleS_L338C]QNH72176.1 hypothetical protein P11VFA_068 [Rhizobium phage P11VFA]
MDATESLPPALKGFLINMIKETMYDAGYNAEQVLKHLAEVEPTLDKMSHEEVTLKLLHEMSDSAYHFC